MAGRKRSTMEQVGVSVKKAAEAVVETANEYVVQPVGKALGLVGQTGNRLSPEKRRALKNDVKTGKKKPRKSAAASR